MARRVLPGVAGSPCPRLRASRAAGEKHIWIVIDYDLRKIRAIAFDVDGVLSRRTITLHVSGEPMRTVNIRDGYAIQYAVKSGLRIAIITGADTEAVRLRYSKLGVEDIYTGAEVKLGIYDEWKRRRNLRDEEIAYAGDDIPDLEVMKTAGCPCCPADAADEIKEVSRYVSAFTGGDGCARDIIERVMRAQGVWLRDKRAFGW